MAKPAGTCLTARWTCSRANNPAPGWSRITANQERCGRREPAPTSWRWSGDQGRSGAEALPQSAIVRQAPRGCDVCAARGPQSRYPGEAECGDHGKAQGQASEPRAATSSELSELAPYCSLRPSSHLPAQAQRWSFMIEAAYIMKGRRAGRMAPPPWRNINQRPSSAPKPP